MLDNRNKYFVLLYYCFTPIKEPEKFRTSHHLYCLENNLRGRIIIASEGINGTISGTQQACKKYMVDLKSDVRFSNTHFKISAYDTPVFQKLHVRSKKEIVHFGVPSITPYQKRGKYITPRELQTIQAKEEVVLLDTRSNYEHTIGKFKGAITLDINHFREFPTKLTALMPYKNKKIIMYCTGGIRCEKASLFLLEQGFKDVYQLQGGIIQYGTDVGGKDFEGKCYVFDSRLAVEVNRINPSVISQCYICHNACDRMINCANPVCNIHVSMCTTCSEKREGACSIACQKHPKKRIYNGTGYYITKMNGYNPYKGICHNKKFNSTNK